MSELVGGGEGGEGGGGQHTAQQLYYTLPEAVTFRFLPGGQGGEGDLTTWKLLTKKFFKRFLKTWSGWCGERLLFLLLLFVTLLPASPLPTPGR